MRRPHWTRTALPAAGVATALCLGGVTATAAQAASGPGAADTDTRPGAGSGPKAGSGAGTGSGANTGAGSGTGTQGRDAVAPPLAPGLSAEAARQLDIKEKMSSFTVKFPAAPYRTTNVGRAVELINGSIVLPGETWSFNKTVGERTKENGFVDGIMINDGRYVKSPGGGVSAVATTMYNAMFFAGVKPLEHGAHSFYIERYPEGREATVAWGTLDLRWLNDSGHPIYIHARSTDHSVTISFLGTKRFDEVRAVKGPRTHVTQPVEREASGPACEAQTPYEGFDVAVDRIMVTGGREVGHETFRTHYTPRDKVTCVPEATPSATTSGAAEPSASGATAPASGAATPSPTPSPTAPAGTSTAAVSPAAAGTSGAPRPAGS